MPWRQSTTNNSFSGPDTSVTRAYHETQRLGHRHHSTWGAKLLMLWSRSLLTVQSNSIQPSPKRLGSSFDPILSHPNQSNPILSDPIQSNPIPPNPIRSDSIRSNLNPIRWDAIRSDLLSTFFTSSCHGRWAYVALDCALEAPIPIPLGSSWVYLTNQSVVDEKSPLRHKIWPEYCSSVLIVYMIC